MAAPALMYVAFNAGAVDGALSGSAVPTIIRMPDRNTARFVTPQGFLTSA
jgi:hypothetical protein